MNYIILISTPDSRGLVHKISSNLLDFNIEKNDEFVDKENEYFFMRTEISVESKNSSLGDGNSPLELHSADFANFGVSQTPSLVSTPKFAKNYESPTENPSVVDSAHSAESSKNDSCEAPKISPDSWCKKSESKGAVVPPADFLLESEKRGSPPKSEKAAAFWRVGGAGRGVQPFLRKEIGESNGKSVDCFGDKSPRNDKSSIDSLDSIQSAIESRLRKILPPQSFIKVTQKRKKSIVIFCTKEAHCLGDLLIKHYNNELDIDIKAVIANHADLGALVEKFHIPYFYISHDSPNFEDSMLEVCARFAPDFIVLAKYMRILSPHFIAHYENRIINIHHSFLPAFIGANPYKQAYTRGVKIIGATAHFVTSELDSGPIICQDIMKVNHTLSWRDMQKAGRNIERVVLARAVELAIDERIFIHKNKTIIF